MRIVGGRDYYDSAQAYGRDMDVVFVRPKDAHWSSEEAAQVGLISTLHPFWVEHVSPRGQNQEKGFRHYRGNHGFKADGVSYVIQGTTVVFCGRLYTGVGIMAHDSSLENQIRKPLRNGPQFFWDWESLQRWAEPFGVRFSRATDMFSSERKAPPESYFVRAPLPTAKLSCMVERRVAIATSPTPFTQPWGSLENKTSWRINGDGLHALQFYKAVDVFAAFQELSMFVGGVLPRNGNPMIQITDDLIKIAKAGFDTRTSFRKAKTG